MTCCTLREVLISNRIEKLLPSSPNLYFGIVAHKFIKLVGQGAVTKIEDFEKEWVSLIREMEEELLESEFERSLVPLSMSVMQYDIKKKLVFKELSHLIIVKKSKYKNEFIPNIERWVESKNGIIGGKIDRINHTHLGYEIIDYKTGTIFDSLSGELKNEYKYQMFLYAGLLFENSNRWPFTLKIIIPSGDEFTVDYNKGQCLTLLDKAKKFYYETNEIILKSNDFHDLQTELANPMPVNCRYCEFRPLCNKYWDSKNATPHLNWNFDIKGDFESLKTLGNGTYLLKIRDGNTTFKVRGLSPHRHIFKKNGRYSIYNLSPDSNLNCYSEKLSTTIYIE
jgi:hypothetical protein